MAPLTTVRDSRISWLGAGAGATLICLLVYVTNASSKLQIMFYLSMGNMVALLPLTNYLDIQTLRLYKWSMSLFFHVYISCSDF